MGHRRRSGAGDREPHSEMSELVKSVDPAAISARSVWRPADLPRATTLFASGPIRALARQAVGEIGSRPLGSGARGTPIIDVRFTSNCERRFGARNEVAPPR